MTSAGATLGLDPALAILRTHPVGLSNGVTFYQPKGDEGLVMSAAAIVYPNHDVVFDQGLVWLLPRGEE